jgi:CheY-specific phosphatase CheX
MKVIKTSISEVMETMFFLPVEINQETSFASFDMDTDLVLACGLRFTGDAKGQMILVAPRTLVAEMAENFMGESRASLTDEHICGTLTEMLNMVCGNALGKMDSKVPFVLSIPEIMDISKILPDQAFVEVETIEAKMAVGLHLE